MLVGTLVKHNIAPGRRVHRCTAGSWHRPQYDAHQRAHNDLSTFLVYQKALLTHHIAAGKPNTNEDHPQQLAAPPDSHLHFCMHMRLLLIKRVCTAPYTGPDIDTVCHRTP